MVTQPGFTQFPGGFSNGVSIRGVPVVNTNPARVFWVSSTIGSDSYRGTQQRPFATLAKATAATATGKNDAIYIMPGHTETVIAAAGITLSNTNVKVIGLGDGEDRPKFTFSTVVGASLRITAAGVSIQNIIGIAGINALTGPIDIRAAGVYVGLEWRDAAAATAAVSPVVTTSAANNLKLDLVVKGFIAGGSNTAAVTLVGGTGARISLDYYGNTGTAGTSAVIVTSTTTVTDLYITGRVNNTGNALFYDGAGSSTWNIDVVDGYADAYTMGGDRLSPGVSSWNDWRYITVFADFTSATWSTAAFHRIAAVTGLVEIKVTPVTSGAVTSGAGATMVLGDVITTNSMATLTTAATAFTAANQIWTSAAGSTSIAAALPATLQAIVASHNIGYTVATNPLTGGGINFHILWRPLSPTSTVVIGAGSGT